MDRCIGNESFNDTGLAYVLKLVKGKYKAQVLYKLREFGVVRFGEMKRYLGDDISLKMLVSTLKELAADDLIIRTQYDQLPPKVEYSLTERGKSLIPLLDGLCAWGDANKPAGNVTLHPASVPRNVSTIPTSPHVKRHLNSEAMS